MLRRLGLACLLGIGLASGAAAQGTAQFDGQYVGELTLTREINDCTPPPLGALYPLTISGGRVQFAYVPRFATQLTGWVNRKGDFQASARLRKGAITMQGRTDGYRLTAFIVSPSCHYTFQTRY